MSFFSSLAKRRLAALSVAAAAAVTAPSAAVAGPVTPVPSLDLAKYTGQWRQIAAIPQWYEALCYSGTKADYSIGPGSTVNVNTCQTRGGNDVVSKGRARVLDTTTNAQLQVSFLNLFGQWVYFDATPNYVVIAIDPDYRWVVIGSPERTSAFVLARDVTLAPADKAKALDALAANGFDASKLSTTRQPGGLQVVQPFNR
ncbi:MAG: lipocalin family protein [Patulibacter minatonensis]